jgi:hypothetical protein
VQARPIVGALLSCIAFAQAQVKPFDPAKGHVKYSFPIRAGGRPYGFEVRLDQAGIIKGLAVYRPGETTAFQVLPGCQADLAEPLNEYDEDRDLIWHGDLNFDGFEDVGLEQWYNSHLGKHLYCMYLWSAAQGRYVYAKDMPDTDPEVHPESKRVTTHEDWFGGVYADTTYQWTGSRFEKIESSGRVSGSDDPKCGFTDSCAKRINGKMVTTLKRAVVCEDGREDPPLVCPANPTRGITRQPGGSVPAKIPPAPADETSNAAPDACKNASGPWSDPQTGGFWHLLEDEKHEISGTLQTRNQTCGTVTWLVSGKRIGGIATITAADPHPELDHCGIAATTKVTATLPADCPTGKREVQVQK